MSEPTIHFPVTEEESQNEGRGCNTEAKRKHYQNHEFLQSSTKLDTIIFSFYIIL